ncbi:hypothetical protein CHUAL_000825 [Chamberlinius hualienensis]
MASIGKGWMTPLKCLIQSNMNHRLYHCSPILLKCQSGRYKTTINRDRPLTYEMSVKPHHIGHHKSWNSWNTSNLLDGNRTAETTQEDMFIRKFMYGTWPGLFVSEVIIKRRHNLIVIAGIIQRSILPRKIYFLTGYTEELLANLLKCPVRIEIQSVDHKKDVIFKYI